MPSFLTDLDLKGPSPGAAAARGRYPNFPLDLVDHEEEEEAFLSFVADFCSEEVGSCGIPTIFIHDLLLKTQSA